MSEEPTPVTRKLISTPLAAKPVAPYNQAVLVDHTLYVSGTLGLDKNTNKLVSGGIEAETHQALKNLGAVLEAGASSFDKVIKTKILLKDIDDFKQVNEIYQEYFTMDFPARCAFQVAKLPLDASIEIEAIAISGDMQTVSGTVGCGTCGPTACPCSTCGVKK